MLLKTLVLQNFRNFEEKNLSFDSDTTIIVGKNTAGKTNILEAINLLSTGKSFKAGREEEIVKEEKEYARATTRINQDGEDVDLEVLIAKPELTGSRFTRKKLLVNKVARQLYNFAGNLKVVLFGPWDLELVTLSPSYRRRFLDTVLSQVDREYRRCLLSYERAVRQRNKVLEKIKEGEAERSQLTFWDKLLIKDGNYISEAREKFIDFANTKEPINKEEFSLEYDKSGISEARLAQYADAEVASTRTLVGPHRDDFIFLKNNKNLATFGSRGEQRMAILWLKLAELDYIERETDQHPVLLLDDIFSELDRQHREIVMNLISQQQTILTSADPYIVENLSAQAGGRQKAKIIELTE